MELQWPLILFTTLIAWSAGVFATQGVLALKGEGKEIQLPALVTSVVLLVLSGIAVFFHLEHWERIFNGFGHLSSGITQELIAIVVFLVVAVAYFSSLRRSEDGGSVPKWLAIVAILISAVLALVCAHSYMMASRPAWDTVVWPLAVLAEAYVLGPLTVLVMLALKEVSARLAGVLAIAGAVLNALLSVILVGIWQLTTAASFTDVGYYFDPTQPTSGIVDIAAEVDILTGALAPLTWVGVIAVGCVIPLVCALLGKKQAAERPKAWLAIGSIGALCALVGCICLRVIFYELGFSVFMFY